MKIIGLCVLILCTCCNAKAVSKKVAETNQKLRYRRAVVFSTAVQYEELTVPVCWEPDRQQKNKTLEIIVQKAIRDTWHKHSGLSFTGWCDCDNDLANRSLRITTKSDKYGPRVNAGNIFQIGQALLGLKGAILLDFEFAIDHPNAFDFCRQDIIHCVRTSAVHEFGHALGFQHEHYHFDRPAWCMSRGPTIPKEGIGKITMLHSDDKGLLGYDKDSIMNYCAEDYMTRPWEKILSEGDINMVRHFYGVPESVTTPHKTEQKNFIQTGKIVDCVLKHTCAWNNRLPCEGRQPYRGHKSTTISGKPCIKWSMVDNKNPFLTESNRLLWGLENHNYCRTAGSGSPWCYTSVDGNEWETCFRDCSIQTDVGCVMSRELWIDALSFDPRLSETHPIKNFRLEGEYCAWNHRSPCKKHFYPDNNGGRKKTITNEPCENWEIAINALMKTSDDNRVLERLLGVNDTSNGSFSDIDSDLLLNQLSKLDVNSCTTVGFGAPWCFVKQEVPEKDNMEGDYKKAYCFPDCSAGWPQQQ